MDKKVREWFLLFVKGMFIGSGFILPGVSGGALAAVFGIYERIITFLAHITKDFKKNVVFFLPVGLGGVTGIFLLSFAVSYFLGAYESQILWFFVGCILGTLPSLWKQAGKHGRENQHMCVLVVTAVVSAVFLNYGQHLFTNDIPRNFGTWMIAGGLIGLGVIVPGLSPSNFLIYMGMYAPMTDAIKALDFTVLIPIVLGGGVCVIVLSKLINLVFQKAYAMMFHFILGVVLASTVMIIPTDFAYKGLGIVVCTVLCIMGIALGYWMGALEDKYKPAD